MRQGIFLPLYVAIAAPGALWSGLCLDHARNAGVGRRCIVSTHGQRKAAGLARRCPGGVFAELAGIHRSGFPAPCSCCVCKSPRCLPFHHISVLYYYTMPGWKKSTRSCTTGRTSASGERTACAQWRLRPGRKLKNESAKFALQIMQSVLYYFCKACFAIRRCMA